LHTVFHDIQVSDLSEVSLFCILLLKGQSKIDHPEKLATRRRKTKQKNTTQYVLDTTMLKKTQVTYISHEPFYLEFRLIERYVSVENTLY
jgi:hypothetical protein